ncbi:MAG: hypothetical protein A2Y77_02180 [Planctomycetes bacterium RBG_13_62_9]|nr:MAG: hypothetical protein A2Y77_02180 [Planctomycetes bacterium RBG_13_62_9]
MKKLIVPVVLIVLIGVGSYAIFAKQPSDAPQRGMGGGMMGRGMMQGGGPMGGMNCPGCAAVCGAMMHESIAATSDGGVVMAVAGKLVKYDSSLKKVSETNIDIDWTAMHQRMQQMMQNCPMMQQMMKPQQGQSQRPGQETP